MKQAEDRQPRQSCDGKKPRIPEKEKMLTGSTSCGSIAKSAGVCCSTAVSSSQKMRSEKYAGASLRGEDVEEV